ncbi:MAG: tetratricopeptide repeat protein [Bacteroidota bacterium]
MLKKVVFVLSLFCTISGFSQYDIDSLKTVLNKTANKKDRLSTLGDLAIQLAKNGNDEQEIYFKKYLALAKDLEEYDLIASNSRFLIQYYIDNVQLDTAKKLCDSLLKFKPFFTKESSEAHLLLKRAGVYFNDENYEDAIEDYNGAQELFMQSGDSIFAADAYYYCGQAHANKNDFLNAVTNFNKAVGMYEVLGDNQYAMIVSSEMTDLYSRNGFVEKSLEERKRLLQRAKQANNAMAQAQIIGQNFLDYYKIGDYDSMKANIDDFLIVVADIDNNPAAKEYFKSFAILHKLYLACAKKNIATANKLMDSVLQISENKEISTYMESDILGAKAVYYELMEDEEKLVPVLEALMAFKNTNRLSTQIKARAKLANIYTKKGQYVKAIELKDYNTKLIDSVNSAQKENRFLYYQSQFEAERKQIELLEQDAEIQQLQIETTRRNNLIVVIILISIITIIIIAFFYLRNRQKIKEQAYQNILLNNKVATKTEEINELLTETIQHIKSKERIAENLQKLSNEKEGITLKSIIADLKANKADNTKLLLIKQNIEQVNFEFIKKLKELHPELSKTDIEICSLARIGLSRKEIANLRNTSIDAVKMSRIRIKKKLNLAEEQGLDDYINAL